MEGHKSHVPNHQPAIQGSTGFSYPLDALSCSALTHAGALAAHGQLCSLEPGPNDLQWIG